MSIYAFKKKEQFIIILSDYISTNKAKCLITLCNKELFLLQHDSCLESNRYSNSLLSLIQCYRNSSTIRTDRNSHNIISSTVLELPYNWNRNPFSAVIHMLSITIRTVHFFLSNCSVSFVHRF